ncbi:MAG: hypothetical protein ACLTZY_01185 [Alistipes indistinctus]
MLRVLYAVASRGASLRSQSDPWLDMEAKGCNWMDLIGGLLEFMSRSTSERTKEALRQRKLSGQSVGRPKGIPPERLERYRAGVMLYRSSGMSVREICAVSGLEVRSFYRYMKSEGIELKRRNEVNGQSEQSRQPAPDPRVGSGTVIPAGTPARVRNMRLDSSGPPFPVPFCLSFPLLDCAAVTSTGRPWPCPRCGIPRRRYGCGRKARSKPRRNLEESHFARCEAAIQRQARDSAV